MCFYFLQLYRLGELFKFSADNFYSGLFLLSHLFTQVDAPDFVLEIQYFGHLYFVLLSLQPLENR
jgi:hypothetical protein